MKEIRLAIKIIKTLVKDSLYYPNKLIANILIVAGRCGVLLALYYYVFKLNGGTINGTTYAMVAWSMFFYFAFSNFNLRIISRMIMRDVQSGNVETILNKPVSYLLYKIWWQIGLGLYNFIFISVVGTITLFLIVGVPTSMTIGIFLPTLFLTFIFASILSLIIYSIVGIFAFWVQDVNPIFWIIDKFVMILGGSYLPIALFPTLMYKLAIYSPFGASMLVTHTVYDSWKTDWAMLVGIQAIWILVLGIFLYWLFKQASKKVSVNGG